MNFYICIDFDGTIVEHEYPHIGQPIHNALIYIDKFIKNGAKIILYTMRSHLELKDAVQYMKNNGIDLYGINENPDQISWTTSPKAYGHLYIDDAAFGCPLIHKSQKRPYVNWDIVGSEVLKILCKIGD